MPVDFIPDKPGKYGFDFIPDEPSGTGWEEANADGGSVMENTAARKKRPVQEEGIFARAERLRQEKLAKLKSNPIATILNQLKADPFSAVGGAYSDAKELLTGERAGGMVPEASLPSVVKGAAGVPMRVSQGFYNLAMPDSPEANAANRMVDDANNWYWKQGLDDSQYGEAMGSSAITAGIPMGAGAKFLQGGGRLAQFGKSMGMGAATGAVSSQIMAPKENIQNSQQYRDEALQDAITGGLTGFAMPAIQEGVGDGARRVSPYLRDFKGFLRSKVDLMSRKGATKPSEAFLEDIGQRQAASNLVGSKIYEKAHEQYGKLKTPAAAEITDYIDNTVLPTLKSKPVVDKGLVSSLEELSTRLKPGRDPITGKMTKPEADSKVENLIDLVRNLRSQSQFASETAGATVQKTRTGAEKKVYSDLDDIIETVIQRKNPKAAEAYNKARKFWSEGDAAFAAPSAFTDERKAGRAISALRGSDQADTKFSNLMKTKSENLAGSLGEVTSKRGKNAMQVEFLKQAEAASKKKNDPTAFIKVFTDSNDELLPVVKEVFKGDDLKALKGFIRLKKFSDVAGKATNIGLGAGIGAALGGPLGVGGSLAGGATGTSLAIWGKRGSWAPNFTARGWEKLVNNKASRAALAVIAEVPPTSPQFAKAMAIIREASKENEDE